VKTIYLTQPKWLYLVAIAVLPWALLLLVKRRHNARHPNTEAIATVWRHGRGALNWIGLCVATTVALFGILLTARPSRELSTTKQQNTVAFALDVSMSMNATDVTESSPGSIPATRLDIAKKSISKMIESAPADMSIALVTIAGSADLVLPATTDKAVLQERVSALIPLEGGTVTGEGIIKSVEALKRVDGHGAIDLPNNAQVFLISDGIEDAGEGLKRSDQAVVIANLGGIRVSTVAYGTDHGVFCKTLQDSTSICSPIQNDPEALAGIARETGGVSYTAETEAQLEKALNNAKGTVIVVKTPVVPPLWEHYLGFAILAVGTFMYFVVARK
jgi:Ca-activated chloride channel homolog